jgi:acyl carrier protein
MDTSTTTKIDPQDFALKMAQVFDDEEDQLTPETEFKQLLTWDSLASVSLLAMVYAEYDVQITGEEIAECEKVDDVRLLVAGKVAASS